MKQYPFQSKAVSPLRNLVISTSLQAPELPLHTLLSAPSPLSSEDLRLLIALCTCVLLQWVALQFLWYRNVNAPETMSCSRSVWWSAFLDHQVFVCMLLKERRVWTHQAQLHQLYKASGYKIQKSLYQILLFSFSLMAEDSTPKPYCGLLRCRLNIWKKRNV